MATQTTAQTAQAVPAAQQKAPRSFSTALRGEDGAVLRIVGVFRKSGEATTFAVHSQKDAKTGKNVNTRGATETHESADAARDRVEELVASAVKAGWRRSERRSGFSPRPDAFTAAALPAPKAKTTSKRR